jgi:methionyl-tRNA formyltransferase
MKIIYFGSGQFGIPSLEGIRSSHHELVGMFTQPARPSGRHHSKLTPTDVGLWCQHHNIPCVEAKNINHPDMIQKIADCGADLLVVIAFGQKISREVIDLHKYGAINVHASLLPKYRGAAPIHWAMLNGETETGVSIITLADRMDAGLILAQAKIPIDAADTFQTMHDKLAELSVPVLMKTIDQLENGTAAFTEQDESQATYAPKLQKKDGFVDWEHTAEQIVNQIRALWPWPGAQSVYVSAQTGRHWRVAISKAHPLPRETKPDDVVGQLDENLHVICGHGALDIVELKPAGSGLMSFDSYLNGRDCQPGDLFVSAEKALSGIF